ncbi:ATP synthase subunit delta, mitochondrial-like [Anopheles bellator]|uniref:ATP synthase subunit delta, mitochondrial-like n=1 Tax=Anopheles bellator TaxID=139047 RepID=UPI002648FFE2|nr:ATP synthase subunit delta, mitochondrial-like [Anopheles bellator]
MSLIIRSAIFTTAQRTLRIQSRQYSENIVFTLAATNKVFYKEIGVHQIDVPSFSGSFGIKPNHVPTLAMLKSGVLTVHQKDGIIKKIFVSSGTITVNADSSVQILAEEAHPVEHLDLSACQEILNEAQRQMSTATSVDIRANAAIAVELAEALLCAKG